MRRLYRNVRDVPSLHSGRPPEISNEKFCGARRRHILSQKQILENILGRKAASFFEWSVRREIAEELADTIVVPARHVVESFTERGVQESRLFRNPYGMDLDMFPATPTPSQEVRPQIMMAGTWSLRKGCD